MNTGAKPIFLEIHHKDTRRAIRAHIEEFNKQLLINNPNDFKKLKIKRNTEDVVFAVLDAYSKHLLRNASNGHTDTCFKINNAAIARMINRSRKCVWENLKRAYSCGIFNRDAYVFHGTNSSYEIAFNHNVLVACHSSEYSDLLIKKHQLDVNNLEIPVEKRVEMLAARPRFSDAKNGCIVTFCNHIVPVINLQEQNINMDKVDFVKNKIGELENSAEFSDETQRVSSHDLKKRQEQGSIKGKKKTVVPPLPPNSSGAIKQEQISRGREFEKVANTVDIDLLNFNVDSALKISLSLLFSDKFVTEFDVQAARLDLIKYFNPEKKVKKMWELSQDLHLALFEAYKSKKRGKFIPSKLWSYFDPRVPYGFYQTLVHVQDVVKPYMEKQKEYSKSIKELYTLLRSYMKNPTSENYIKASQFLGKKKNKFYLEFFNQSVVSPSNIDFSQIHNNFIDYLNQAN